MCFYPNENDAVDGKVGDAGLRAGRDFWSDGPELWDRVKQARVGHRGPNQQHLGRSLASFLSEVGSQVTS